MNNFYSFEAAGIFSWIQAHAYVFPVIVLAIVIGIVLFILTKYWNIRKLLNKESVFLELTPPAFTDKSAYTTQQLFSVIHSIGRQLSFWDRLFGRKQVFSFEIVSTRKEGIRYLIRTDAEHADSLKRTIVSYLPSVRVKTAKDYLPENVDVPNTKIINFKLRKHFAFPLAKQNVLNQHDPVAYITGMMTQLKEEEVVSLQIVVSPTVTTEASLLNHKILRNEDVLRYLNGSQSHWLLNGFSMGILYIFKGIQEIVWFVFDILSSNPRQERDMLLARSLQQQMQYDNKKPARVLSVFEQEVVASIQEKIDQSLFETSIRACIIIHDKKKQNQRVQEIKSSLATYSIPKYQALQAAYTVPFRLVKKLQYFVYKHRLLSPFSNKSSSLLSVSEIASLYHFPFSNVTQTENIVKVHSKELPAPLSLKDNPELDNMFAKNTYGGTETMIGLTKEERVRHMYVIGATGTGKTTMLLSMIQQDIQNGKGVCLIDPHGDLAEAAIQCIPEERKNDLIYFNPYDIAYPIGVNLLELTPHLPENEALLEKEFITESVVSLFRKMFSDGMTGHPHRIEYILRNTIHTALTLENPTLFTIFDLLNNPPFQKKAIQGLTDENLKNFWKYEFGKAGDFQKVKMVAPVTARIGRFLFSPIAKRIFEQERSTINFDEILDQNRILICNLSKGNIGEDTSEVMGIMLLNKIQLAILKRARKEQQERNHYYLYVDEFQNFATPSFVQMLSESRKYGLSLTMAEQSTSQQKDKNLVQVVLANAGTVVTFRSANPEDEKILLPQFRPYIQEGEITNLPSFHFYMKKAAMKPEEPFSGLTIVTPIKKNRKKLQSFIEASRKNYAHEYDKELPQQKRVKISATKEKRNRQSEKGEQEEDSAYPE